MEFVSQVHPILGLKFFHDPPPPSPPTMKRYVGHEQNSIPPGVLGPPKCPPPKHNSPPPPVLLIFILHLAMTIFSCLFGFGLIFLLFFFRFVHYLHMSTGLALLFYCFFNENFTKMPIYVHLFTLPVRIFVIQKLEIDLWLFGGFLFAFL